MDWILDKLQGKSFNLPDPAFKYLSERYTVLLSEQLVAEDMGNGIIIRSEDFINRHRAQFNSEEYYKSRIDDPREGTVDHLHAEITSHTALTLSRIKKLDNYAQLLVQTAGHLHDSERSYPQTRIDIDEESYSDRKKYAEYKLRHSKNSCNTVLNIYHDLTAEGINIPFGFVEDLNYIILRHETGGDGESKQNPSSLKKDINLNELCDIVMTADSISYFDANIMTHWEEINKDENLLRRKIHFMYSRLPEQGKILIKKDIINSSSHIFGINYPEQEDIKTIRCLISEECR